MRFLETDPSGHTRRDADNLRERGINPADVATRNRGRICPLCPFDARKVDGDVWHAAGYCDAHYRPPVVVGVEVAA